MSKIPDKSVDLVLTDPPYNISQENNFKSMGRDGIDFGEWDKDADILSYIKQASRILKKDGSFIVFNAWRNLGEIANECEKHGLVVKDMLRWKKSNPMPRNRDRRYVVDFECAIWCIKKGANWTFNRQEETYNRPEFVYPVVGGKEKVGHPTQKSVALIEELIKIHSNENDVVVDPFMGSSTTAIACLNTNRNFIGYELDKEYYNLSCKRIYDRLQKEGCKNISEFKQIHNY